MQDCGKDQQPQKPFEADRRIAQRRRLHHQTPDAAGRHGVVRQLAGRDRGERRRHRISGRARDLPAGGQKAAIIEDADDRLAMPGDAFAKPSGNMHEPHDRAGADGAHCGRLVAVAAAAADERRCVQRADDRPARAAAVAVDDAQRQLAKRPLPEQRGDDEYQDAGQ
jgi:hypothetical protein